MNKIRAALCLPLGMASMSVYAHSLGGWNVMNLQQLFLAAALTVIPSCLAITFKETK